MRMKGLRHTENLFRIQPLCSSQSPQKILCPIPIPASKVQEETLDVHPRQTIVKHSSLLGWCQTRLSGEPGFPPYFTVMTHASSSSPERCPGGLAESQDLHQSSAVMDHPPQCQGRLCKEQSWGALSLLARCYKWKLESLPPSKSNKEPLLSQLSMEAKWRT